jgi:hypothetical protein
MARAPCRTLSITIGAGAVLGFTPGDTMSRHERRDYGVGTLDPPSSVSAPQTIASPILRRHRDMVSRFDFYLIRRSRIV